MSEMSVYSGASYEESVSAVTLIPSVDLGSRRTWKGEDYVYCYNAGGGSINAEYGANMITGASGYSIAGTGVTDACLAPVGVVKHATLITASYGWVMTKGYTNVHSANSANTGDMVPIGPCVAVANNGGAFGLAAGGAAGTNVGCGFAPDMNTASAGTFYAFISTGY